MSKTELERRLRVYIWSGALFLLLIFVFSFGLKMTGPMSRDANDWVDVGPAGLIFVVILLVFASIANPEFALITLAIGFGTYVMVAQALLTRTRWWALFISPLATLALVIGLLAGVWIGARVMTWNAMG